MIKIATRNVSDKIFIIVSWQWYANEYTLTQSNIKSHIFDIHAVLKFPFIWIVKYEKKHHKNEFHKKIRNFCDLWMKFRNLGLTLKFKVQFFIQISYRNPPWNANAQLNKWKTKLMSKMKEVTVLKIPNNCNQ